MLSKLKIKYIQTLGQKKFREEEDLFIAEGPKLVKELLESAAVKIQEIYALSLAHFVIRSLMFEAAATEAATWSPFHIARAGTARPGLPPPSTAACPPRS